MEYALAAIVLKQVRAWPAILGSEPNCFLAPGAMVDTLAKQLGSDPKITASAPALVVLKGTSGAVNWRLNLKIATFAPAFAVLKWTTGAVKWRLNLKITASAPALAVLNGTTGAVKLGSDPNFPLTSPKQAACRHRKLGSDPHFTGHRLRRLGRVTCGTV